MFLRRGLIAFLAALSLLGSAEFSFAEKRVALVIGNSAYQNTAILANPTNDAKDVAEALKALGFTVIFGTDLDKASMDRKVRDFAEELSGAKLGLFFYAGHGLQYAGHNYLVPIDAKLTTAPGLDFEMVRLDLVQRSMEAESQVNLIFLDACRDNPLGRNLARAMGTRSTQIGTGLAAMESGVGTLISFSTQPGNVALDGSGRNSPYTGPFLKHIAKPGQDLSDILIAVRNDVMATTGNKQVPWEHSALRAKFYFTPPAPVVPIEVQVETNFWEIVKNSDNIAVLQTYLDRYPKGNFADTANSLIERRKQELKSEQARLAGEALQVEDGKRASEVKRLEDAQAAAATPKLAAVAPTENLRSTDSQATPATKFASFSPEELTAALKKELGRVGCDPGSTDGKWGDKATAALVRFVRYTKVGIATDRPTPEALDIISAQRVRICPLECGEGRRAVDDKCVAIPRSASRDDGKPSAGGNFNDLLNKKRAACKGGDMGACRELCSGSGGNNPACNKLSGGGGGGGHGRGDRRGARSW